MYIVELKKMQDDIQKMFVHHKNNWNKKMFNNFFLNRIMDNTTPY